MNSSEPTTRQDKLYELADHLRAASDLLRELASEKVLPLADDQAWFWSDRWQAMEKEADDADQQGAYNDFNNTEDALEFLHRQV